MEVLTKTCKKCGVEKSLIEFYRWKYSKTGSRNICRVCEKEYMNKWRKKHPYKVINNMRAYSKRHPFQTNGLSVKKLEELYWSHPYCEYCKMALSLGEASLDHVIPMSRGGTHSIDNIVISCLDCNYLKGTKTRQEFLIFIKEYISRFKDNIERSSERERATASPEIMGINTPN